MKYRIANEQDDEYRESIKMVERLVYAKNLLNEFDDYPQALNKSLANVGNRHNDACLKIMSTSMIAAYERFVKFMDMTDPDELDVDAQKHVIMVKELLDLAGAAWNKYGFARENMNQEYDS